MKKICSTLFILLLSISLFADHYDDGLLWIEKGNYKQAFNSFELALAKTPNNPKIQKAFANAAFKSRQYIQAIPVYEGLLRKEPKNSSILIRLAKMYSYSTQKYKSAEYGERAQKIGAKNQEDILLLAETFFFIKNYRGAIDLYNKLDVSNQSIHRLAKSYVKMGNFKAGIEQYEKLINRGSKNSVHFFELGNALYDNGNFHKAAIILQKADEVGFTDKKRLNLTIAYAYTNIGKNAESLKFMDRALKNDPYDKNLNLDKVDFLIRAKEFRKARVHINEMLKNFPDDADVIYTLGMSYYKEGNTAKAERWFDLAFKKNPSLKSLRYTKNSY